MKVQVNTKDKTIKIEDAVNIGEFVETLKSWFPHGKWKEFKLESTIIQNWSNPIYIDRYVPNYPWYPYTTYDTNTGIKTCTDGWQLTTSNITSDAKIPNEGVFNCFVN